jgi:hypothetical protein
MEEVNLQNTQNTDATKWASPKDNTEQDMDKGHRKRPVRTYRRTILH